MDILISFRKIENKDKRADLKNTIFKYSFLYNNAGELLELLSSKEITEEEAESLCKIYCSKNRDEVIRNKIIDVIIDRYIIVSE